MSRCFPYPPPGFTLSRPGEAGLIESIKLQREKRKSKEVKKDSKRKEKKQRKREKEVKGNADGKKNQIAYTSDISKGHIGENIWAKNEPLETSGLTEEHEQPTCSHEPSPSYESTENNNKRKRQFSLVFRNPEQGTMIKIRLPPPKAINVSDASMDQQLCSTSGRMDLQTQDKVEIGLKSKPEGHPCPSGRTSNFSPGLTPRTDEELIGWTSQKVDDAVSARIGTPPPPIASKQSKDYLQYKYLTEDCIRAPLQHALSDPEDLSWLFCSKNEGNQSEKRQKLQDDLLIHSSSDFCQPWAQYLPEAGLFSLPYTIPF